MKLRDHPHMNFLGGRNWPPPWIPIPITNGQVSVGEIGMLEEAHLSAIDDRKCYLTVRHEGHTYTGTLRFENSEFCKEVRELLERNYGRPIKELPSGRSL
jgi:hypothetical protein